MSTTGALKQRLIFRFIGSLIGGLILGIGSAAFLFPHMDSVTSLVVLVAAVAFVAAWWATGRQFSYIGVQIAFSFYLVAFEDFRAPTELAPARDRLVGILLALVVMAMVFDLIWPVRTVTIMRLSLASVLRADSELLRLVDSSEEHAVIVQKADGIRDRTGKTVAALRGLNDVVAYEFGVDREEHIRLGDTIIRAAFAAVGLFWNQLAILHSERDRDFVGETGLMEMRRQFAQQIDAMADAVVRRIRFPAADSDSFGDSLLLQNPRFTEYARNAAKQYAELRAIICTLGTQI
jgi:multidrug resistance protein MdtO